MVTALWVSLLSGLSGVAGGALALSRNQLREAAALGAGFLLGGALFAMLPEALHVQGGGPVAVAAGFLGLFLLRRLSAGVGSAASGPAPASAWAAALGLCAHSFFDGAALGVALLAGGPAALGATAAMVLHKLPEGFSISALTLTTTGSRRAGMAAAAALGLAGAAGIWSAVAWAALAGISRGSLLGLAAGSFLYVGAVEMLPSLARGGRFTWLVLVGVAIIYLLSHGGAHTH